MRLIAVPKKQVAGDSSKGNDTNKDNDKDRDNDKDEDKGKDNDKTTEDTKHALQRTCVAMSPVHSVIRKDDNGEYSGDIDISPNISNRGNISKPRDGQDSNLHGRSNVDDGTLYESNDFGNGVLKTKHESSVIENLVTTPLEIANSPVIPWGFVRCELNNLCEAAS